MSRDLELDVEIGGVKWKPGPDEPVEDLKGWWLALTGEVVRNFTQDQLLDIYRKYCHVFPGRKYTGWKIYLHRS